MIRISIISFLLFCNFSLSFSKEALNEKDSLIFSSCVEKLAESKDLPINQLFVETVKLFVGNSYVSATLEGNYEEKLIVNLREFDCTTLVESALALSLEMKENEPCFVGFKEKLQQIRYRGGKIDGYTSRLHYVTEWIIDNSDILDNVTLDLGGQVVNKPLSFMSSKPHLYPALKDNIQEQEKIKLIELDIRNRADYVLIGKAQLNTSVEQIKTGDIIVFGTNVAELDYSHMGVALWEDGILKLLHASSVKKEVIIDNKSLEQYCMDSKSCTGITVLRLKGIN